MSRRNDREAQRIVAAALAQPEAKIGRPLTSEERVEAETQAWEQVRPQLERERMERRKR